jgi:hypothetical protein
MEIEICMLWAQVFCTVGVVGAWVGHHPLHPKHFIFARGQHVEKYPKVLSVFPTFKLFQGLLKKLVDPQMPGMNLWLYERRWVDDQSVIQNMYHYIR